MNCGTRNDDDMIPDPNAALFTDGNISTELVLQFMNSVSKSVASSTEGFRHLTKQMDTLAASVNILVKAETDWKLVNNNTKNDINRLDQSNNERKEDIKVVKSEMKEIRAIAVKALGQINALENTISTSCSSTTKSIKADVKEEIKEEVDNVKSHVRLGWVIFALMGGALVLVSKLLVSSTLDTIAANTAANTKVIEQSAKDNIKAFSLVTEKLQALQLQDSKTYQTLQLHIGSSPKH